MLAMAMAIVCVGGALVAANFAENRSLSRPPPPVPSEASAVH